MDYVNPVFVFGSANADRGFGLWFMAAFTLMLGAYYLLCKLSERRKARYDTRKDERESKEAAEEKAYRLDRRENPFIRQFGEYKITEAEK